MYSVYACIYYETEKWRNNDGINERKRGSEKAIRNLEM